VTRGTQNLCALRTVSSQVASEMVDGQEDLIMLGEWQGLASPS
jgi:hypothetical protein